MPLPHASPFVRTPVLVLALVAALIAGSRAGEGRLRILCTTFPIHQITRNVAAGRDAEVDLLLPPAAGCPHDYAPTPLDLLRLTEADILVTNGLGMEEFLPLLSSEARRGGAKYRVVDGSRGVDGLLPFSEFWPPDSGGHGHGEDDHHAPQYDSHLFASPAMSGRIALSIAEGLAALDPEGADLYRANAAKYAAAMRRLAEEAAALGRSFERRRVTAPVGEFDYLFRDLGLENDPVLPPHEVEMSAADLLRIRAEMVEKKPAAVILDPEYPARIGETLTRETGVPVLRIDPGAAGPENAPLDHFETIARRNFAALAEALGQRGGGE